MACGEPVQFLIDERHQRFERLLVAIAPGDEQRGHFLWRRYCHSNPVV